MDRLHIDGSGRLVGSYGPGISYNNPWPCGKGDPGATYPPFLGTIFHTMVGNLPGTISMFNSGRPPWSSAHFGVDQEGHIHQFGPIPSWQAWHVADGNGDWFGIEFADDGSPNNAYTTAQKWAGALIVDAIHTKYDIPVQVTDSVSRPGIGRHSMGGAAWGGHACPDDPYHPNHVRSLSRTDIVDKVNQLRHGVVTPVSEPDEEEVMELKSGSGAETPIAFSGGSKTYIAFLCDPGRTGSPRPKLRIAIHGRDKWHTTNSLTLESDKQTFAFPDDSLPANGLTVVRTGNNAGDLVPIAFNLGS